jgi:hypothetical protein
VGYNTLVNRTLSQALHKEKHFMPSFLAVILASLYASCHNRAPSNTSIETTFPVVLHVRLKRIIVYTFMLLAFSVAVIKSLAQARENTRLKALNNSKFHYHHL